MCVRVCVHAHVRVCVYMCMHAVVHRWNQRITCGVGSPLPPCEPGGLNSGHQAYGLVSLPTEPSHLPFFLL